MRSKRGNRKDNLLFFGGALLVFAAVQLLINVGIISPFWSTIVLTGGVMAIVTLGLNLIYGFSGQFSMGQWGFYAIGAYGAADVTYRWSTLHNASGLVVLGLCLLLVGVVIGGVNRLLRGVHSVDTLTAFIIYLLLCVGAVVLGVRLGQGLIGPVTAFLQGLDPAFALQLVFFLAVLLGGALAAEVSFLFGLPVLALGSDYFGIATLGLSIIVKVLLDNSDTILGFQEMKGARGMIGIPKVTTWAWVFVFLLLALVILRNLLHSSSGRAIVSVREDEVAARAMGINVAEQKNLAFVVGSFLAGAAGALYAHINGFLVPSTFSFIRSFDPLIILVFGGLGSLSGTVIASFGWALVLEGLLRLFLPTGFENWRYVIYPLLLLMLMLLKPRGLLAGYELPFLRQRVPPRTASAPEPAPAAPVAPVNPAPAASDPTEDAPLNSLEAS